MSVSSTRVRTCTVSRFAILKSTVPPPTSVVGDEITVPNSTFFAMIVPASGARMRVWVAVLHIVARLDVHPDDLARRFGLDVDRENRLDGTRRYGRDHDRAPFHGHCFVHRRGVRLFAGGH